MIHYYQVDNAKLRALTNIPLFGAMCVNLNQMMTMTLMERHNSTHNYRYIQLHSTLFLRPHIFNSE